MQNFYKILGDTSNLKVSEGGNKNKYDTEDPETVKATMKIYSRSGELAPDKVIKFNTRIYLISH